jgi:hypothetical protein
LQRRAVFFVRRPLGVMILPARFGQQLDRSIRIVFDFFVAWIFVQTSGKDRVSGV